jgi:drug/metabolite transporter (DMT)-like permease
VTRSSFPRLRIFLAALLFSTGGAAVKACDLSAWQVACFRSAVAFVVLWIALPRWRRFTEPASLLVGVAYAGTMLLYVVGNKLTTAANLIFLQATAPAYLLLLGPWLLRERIQRSDLVFTATMGAGMAMFFVGVEPTVETAPDPRTGNLIGVLCGLCWALTLLGLRWLGRREHVADHDPGGAAVVAGNLLAALIALPFVFPLAEVRAIDGLIVVYLGVFQIGLAYVAMTGGVRGVSALEASLLLLLEPVLATVWAWLLHTERPGPWSLGGCLVILVASVVRTLRRARGSPNRAMR